MSYPWDVHFGIVLDEIARHPEIKLGGTDAERGKLVDAVAIRLNGGTTKGPWGRKARDRDGGRKNGDGLTFLRTDQRFEIVDIIKGLDTPPPYRADYADWTPKGDFAPGENGWWAEAEPIDGVATPPPVDQPDEKDPVLVELQTNCRRMADDIQALKVQKANLEARLEQVERGKDDQDGRLAELDGRLRYAVVKGPSAGRGVFGFSHYHDIHLPVLDSRTLPKDEPKKGG